MVLTAGAPVAEEGGDSSTRLEDRVPVTEAGPERLSRYRFDPALSGI